MRIPLKAVQLFKAVCLSASHVPCLAVMFLHVNTGLVTGYYVDSAECELCCLVWKTAAQTWYSVGDTRQPNEGQSFSSCTGSSIVNQQRH